jgi:hypothetical protein
VTWFRRFSFALICAAALCAILPSALMAKGHGKKNPPQDGIEVLAHLPLASEPITHFVQTQHYRRNYLYAESKGGETLTLIDVTDVAHPTILSSLSPSLRTGNVVAAAGTAALVSDSPATAPTEGNGQTFRIMSFADPKHPSVKQEFANVSAISRDDHRGLIFMANAQGIWILQEKLAMDPEFEREWEHAALDNR